MSGIPTDALFKRFGVLGLLVALVASAAGWYVQHLVESREKPGSIVVQVKGAYSSLLLRLDNRKTDAPESKAFFRVENIQPGQHLIELMSAEAAIFSKQATILGGRDNLVDVDLQQYRTAPSIFNLPKTDQDGWMYLGSIQNGREIDSRVAGSIVALQPGSAITSQAPAFLRSSAPKAGSGIGYGEAFSTVPTNTVLNVAELSKAGDGELWARVVLPSEGGNL